MTNKPKSRRSKNVVNARNGASAAADSSSGLNAQANTPTQLSILAEEPLGNSDSTTPTIDDMHSIDHGPNNQPEAYTDTQSLPSESGPYPTPASGLGPGDPSSLPTEDVKNIEAPKVKSQLTNKQLKKKARKQRQAQKAKVAPGAISIDEFGVQSASAEAISHSPQEPMPALIGTIVPSENEISSATENERPSRPNVSDSSSDLHGQLLVQRMEFRQRIEEADKEFEALMADLRLQGIAVEAKYAGLMSGIKQWTNEREVPADANAPMPKQTKDAAIPAFQRKFSFTEGRPDNADTRPILMDSSELPDQRSSKGKMRCINSSDNTLVDEDILLDNGNDRNFGPDVAEPFWTAKTPERPKQPTSPLHEEGESSSHVDADARSSDRKQSIKLPHNITDNGSSMQMQEGSSRPSENEEDAVDDEEDYSGDDYGEQSEGENISDEMAEMLEWREKKLRAFIQKKREEVSALQDRILSQRGYVKRRGTGRR